MAKLTKVANNNCMQTFLKNICSARLNHSGIFSLLVGGVVIIIGDWQPFGDGEIIEDENTGFVCFCLEAKF